MSKQKRPKIRFKGFDGEWEEREFLCAFDCSIPNNNLSRAELNYEFGEIKNIHYGDILIKFGEITDVTKEEIPFINNPDISKYKTHMLKDGDIIFADTAEDETVGKATEITAISNEKLVSGLHTIVCRPKEIKPVGYLGYYINSLSYHRQLLPLMQGIKVLSISKRSLTKTIISHPDSEAEQSQIGNFFKNLDNLIALKQRMLDKLVNVKKSCLEKMFPKNGAHKPEVRFKGFDREWERRMLGEYFEERNERSCFGELISVTINSGIMKAADLGRFDNSSNDKSNYKKVEIGDIAYNSMRMWQGASGHSLFSGILSPAYTVIKSCNNVSSLFFSYMFKLPHFTNQFQINSQGLTSDTWNLKFPAFSKLGANAPDLTEQSQIGDFFKTLDKLISLRKTELDKLKNIKKSCLEKMFI